MNKISLYNKSFLFSIFLITTIFSPSTHSHTYQILVKGDLETKKIKINLFQHHGLGTRENNKKELETLINALEASEVKKIPTLILLESPFFYQVNIKDEEELNKRYYQLSALFQIAPMNFSDHGPLPKIPNNYEVTSSIGWGLPYNIATFYSESEFIHMKSIDARFNSLLFYHNVESLVKTGKPFDPNATYGLFYAMLVDVLDEKNIIKNNTPLDIRLKRTLAKLYKDNIYEDFKELFPVSEEELPSEMDKIITKKTLFTFFRRISSKINNTNYQSILNTFFLDIPLYIYLANAHHSEAHERIVFIAGGNHIDDSKDLEDWLYRSDSSNENERYITLHQVGLSTEKLLNNMNANFIFDDLANPIYDTITELLSMTNEEIWDKFYFSGQQTNKKRNNSEDYQLAKKPNTNAD